MQTEDGSPPVASPRWAYHLIIPAASRSVGLPHLNKSWGNDFISTVPRTKPSCQHHASALMPLWSNCLIPSLPIIFQNCRRADFIFLTSVCYWSVYRCVHSPSALKHTIELVCESVCLSFCVCVLRFGMKTQTQTTAKKGEFIGDKRDNQGRSRGGQKQLKTDTVQSSTENHSLWGETRKGQKETTKKKHSWGGHNPNQNPGSETAQAGE